MLKVNITEGLKKIGVPLISFKKDGETLIFLLDTGASMNFIRREVLDRFSDDVKQLAQKIPYHGIDNMCHETGLYNFAFKLAGFEYNEVFQEIENSDALTFDMNEELLEIHGVLGTNFFVKYHAVFNYGTNEMIFSAPNEIS